MDRKEIIQAFHEGHCFNAYEVFGAHFSNEEGERGVRFTVYAPHAANVQLIGSFTNWAASPIPMIRTVFAGVWSVFVPYVKEWETYKYRITDGQGKWVDKADPYAFYSETRPANASKIYDLSDIHWADKNWLKKRSRNFDAPLNIYEVYAGGWKRNGEYPYTYSMLQEELIPYVKEHGFTHIEMMPLNEYPFDGSWGYQASGYYSVTSRYGNPTEFASFVNACHKAGIGVIMDMVPVHFVKDEFGLRYFDGQPLYEYSDSVNSESEWGTMNFNLWSEEVRSFLISAACFWISTYHIDGIRIDAVSNLIYWGGNRDRGVNEGSVTFVRRLNDTIHETFPEVMMIAEDSSDYPMVTTMVDEKNGLGFDYKWDLGWMNDTLKYYSSDPLYRVYMHNKINFSMAYYYSERFIMPLSHDENVHGKKTMVDRMFGNYDQKFSQVRNLYAYMYAHPGKKLNFMGNEIASFREFDEKKQLDWFLLDYPRHAAFARYFTDLNKIYAAYPCLYQYDYDRTGFRWIDADDAKESVYSFYREDQKEYLVCILNMTGASYEEFKLFVPQEGIYTEILNSEKDIYDGCNMCNFEPLHTELEKKKPYINIRLAPFGAVWFTCKKHKSRSHRKLESQASV